MLYLLLRMKSNWLDIGTWEIQFYNKKRNIVFLESKKYIWLYWLWRMKRNWLDIGEQTCCVSTALGLAPRLTRRHFFYIAFNVFWPSVRTIRQKNYKEAASKQMVKNH